MKNSDNLKRVAWSINRNQNSYRYQTTRSRVHLVEPGKNRTLCGKRIPRWLDRPADSIPCGSCHRFCPGIKWANLDWI